LAAVHVRDPAGALPPGVPLRADDRERDRLPAVPTGRLDVRRRVGRLLLLPDVHPEQAVLGRLLEHRDPRRPHPVGLLPAADHPRAAAQRAAVADVQARGADHHLPAALHVDRDRRRHGLPAHRHQRLDQPAHRGVRWRGDPVHAARRLVPAHLPDVRGVADRRLGHHPLPRPTERERRRAPRGCADRRRQPVAAHLAHHAPGHPADDDGAAHPQHRHLHGCRVREGPPALQPPHVRHGRRAVHVPLPGRYRGGRQLLVRRRDRPVRGADRRGTGRDGQPDLEASGGSLPVVTTNTPDSTAVRTTTTTVRDTPGYRAFRIANAFLLVVITFLTLYPFLNMVAKAFSSQAYIAAGEVNLWPRGFNLTTFAS